MNVDAASKNVPKLDKFIIMMRLTDRSCVFGRERSKL